MLKAMKTFFSLLGLSALTFPGAVLAETYSVGQVWSYKTRPGEETSRVIIVKIEPHSKLENIYHLYVEGVKIRNPHIEGGLQTSLPHVPVAKQTLDASLVKMAEKRSRLPDISVGYQAWKQAFDSGQGGVFTIPLSEIVQYVEEIVSGARK